ncbi:MAG: hypothetical protein Q8S23_08720 [Bacteroidales bacterium]|nr:hypothetical protein [Bacteroidales bacterium]
MKKILILLSGLILCFSTLSAQNLDSVHISEAGVEKTIQINEQLDNSQIKVETLSQNYDNISIAPDLNEHQKNLINDFRLIAFSLFSISIILILVSFFYFKKVITRIFINIEKIEDRINKNNRNQSVNLTNKDLNIIIEKIINSGQLNKTKNQNPVIYSEEKNDFVSTAPKYLKGKSGNSFSRVEETSNNSFFRLFNENGDQAFFEFYGDEAEAIAKRIFSEDICIIVSGGYQNAKSVIVKKPGKLKFTNDLWEVVEPLEINLI